MTRIFITNHLLVQPPLHHERVPSLANFSSPKKPRQTSYQVSQVIITISMMMRMMMITVVLSFKTTMMVLVIMLHQYIHHQ